MNDTMPASREGVKESENNINNSSCESNVIQEGLMVSRYYQVYNPKTKRWVKIDFYTGLIVAEKKTPLEYKKIPKMIRRVVKKKKSVWDVFLR